MKKLIDICVRRPIAVTMLTLFVIVLGFVSVSKLKLDLYPKIDFPVMMIFTNYEGAGPEEIENLITRPIESAVSAVPNVKKVTSDSSQGSSTVLVECNYGTNMDFTNLKMRERIDLIKDTLPEDADEPVIFKFDPSMMPIVFYGFSSPKGLAEATRLVKDKVKVELERVPGVASVQIMGELEREIKVKLSAERMAFYKVSPTYLVESLKSQNSNLPGGVIDSGKNELVVRTLGEFQTVDEVKSLKIVLPGGGIIPLQEVADIEDSYHEQKQYSRINGKTSLLFMVMKESDANTVLVTREVRKTLNRLKDELKNKATFYRVFEQAEYIEKSIDNVKDNAISGGLLAILVLFVFLRNIRSTFVIGVTIPVSIIATFALIYFSNMTLNLVSMGGLALGIGMLIDNSVVILEVIHRYHEEGHDVLSAAVEGTSEVSQAITASTLTSIVVFVPILFVEGITAQIFREMALTVSYVQVTSLFVAITLIPMLASKMMTANLKKKAAGKVIKEYRLGALEKMYRIALEWALNHRKQTVIIAFILFILGFIPFFTGLKTDFTPTMGEKEYNVSIEMPLGTNLETTDKVARQIEKELLHFPETDLLFSMVGSSSNFGAGSGGESEQAQIMVTVKEKTKESLNEIIEKVRKKVTGIPGATVKVAVEDHGGMSGSGAPIEINIEGSDLTVLQQLADQVSNLVKSVPGTREVSTNWKTGSPQLQLRVDRQRANAYGLTPVEIAGAVQTAFQGTAATQIRLKGEEYDLFLQLQKADRMHYKDIEKLFVVSQSGLSIPITEVVKFELTKGPNKITRENQTRQIQITAQIHDRDLGAVSQDIQSKIDREIIVPSNYNIVLSGKVKEMREAFSALFLAFLGAAFLVYMVIAIQYENLIHPLAIMGTVPLSLFGITWSLFLTGRTFDVSAFIGVIMLVGIVVNNGIVLVDYIETLRSRGQHRREAILEAGPTRLRPVLMTALSSVIGLFPMALGIGEGAELNVSMATVVIGGLTFCTMLTLVVIPIVYSILDDWATWTRKTVFRKTEVVEYHR